MGAPIRIFNTLGRAMQDFAPACPGSVGMYSCGPTSYRWAHLGNLRTYVLEDLIRRTLIAADHVVTHVMKITDISHLQHGDRSPESDDDASGELDPIALNRPFEQALLDDMEKLNVSRPTILCRPVEHVPAMISFIKVLEDRGFAYESGGNVYFAVEKSVGYGALAQLDASSLGISRLAGDRRKRHDRDFALWLSDSKYTQHILRWDSPWGRGFPAWHVQCSVMASHYLGSRIDLHLGNIHHATIHHVNEIAQSDAYFGHQCVSYWAHSGYLLLDDVRSAQDSRKPPRLDEILEGGFDAADFRYFCAQAHYRSDQRFSWERLASARRALTTLRRHVADWEAAADPAGIAPSPSPPADAHRNAFWEATRHDFNMPEALAAMWKLVRDRQLPDAEKLMAVRDFDRVLGIGLDVSSSAALPRHLADLIRQRSEARSRRDWERADALRDELRAHGVRIRDRGDDTDWFPA